MNRKLVRPWKTLSKRSVTLKYGKSAKTMAALFLTALLFTACITPRYTGRSLLIPVGRSAVVGGGSFQVLIDSEPYVPQLTDDGYGGFWADVPYYYGQNKEVVLQITVKGEKAGLYRDKDDDAGRWLLPSDLIDSDDPELTAKAEKLTGESDTVIEKARSIQDFVINHLTFKVYRDHFRFRASETFAMGYGTCVNHARLFTALCRAAGVPARTVWGIIYNEGVYDWHHEWAEFMDEDGYWHPLDFTFTTAFDLSDIRYLDLIYSSEENPLYEQSRTERYNGDAVRFIVCDTTDLPFDGRLGFKVANDDSPVSIVIENRYVPADLPRMVPQRVP